MCSYPVSRDVNRCPTYFTFSVSHQVGNLDSDCAAPSLWDSGHVVVGNTASGLASEYAGSAGFFGGFVMGLNLSSNTISDAGYSGVSVGWGWGREHPVCYGLFRVTSSHLVSHHTYIASHHRACAPRMCSYDSFASHLHIA